jgi:predicted Zn finger-like uncharacterized protein
VIIRCERCSTLYELDESLLAQDGSDVQCTKCQHVFTAYPPRVPGKAAAGAAPRSPEPAARPAPPPPPVEDGPEPVTTPAPAEARPAGASSRPPAEPGARASRSGGPPVYRPPASSGPSAPPPVQRSPILKRDAVGAFESRLRWSHRLRWLVPAAAVAVVALAVASWFLLRRHGPSGDAVRRRGEGMALLVQDDRESLARAEEILEGAAAAGIAPARADAALARALRADALGGEGAELAERARAELRQAEKDLGADPGVARALAVTAALSGDRDRATAYARAARGGGPEPWADLADGLVDLGGDAASRERGVARLRTVASKHPEILRARYVLAAAEAETGRRQEAIATLDRLLQANPRHERARRLRTELAAAAPAPALVTVPPPPPASAAANPEPAPEAKPARVSRSAAAPAASPVPPPAEGGAQGPPAASQPTAPVAPAPLPVVSPRPPGPSTVPGDADGPASPGGGGDAGGSGTRRPRGEEAPDGWPETTGG